MCVFSRSPSRQQESGNRSGRSHGVGHDVSGDLEDSERHSERAVDRCLFCFVSSSIAARGATVYLLDITHTTVATTKGLLLQILKE